MEMSELVLYNLCIDQSANEPSVNAERIDQPPQQRDEYRQRVKAYTAHSSVRDAWYKLDEDQR